MDQMWTILVKQSEFVLSPTHLTSTQKEGAMTHQQRSEVRGSLRSSNTEPEESMREA